LIKDENGDLLAYNILNRWKNYFSQLLNVHGVSEVRQIEIHIDESLVPEPSPSVIEIAIAKLKKFKSFIDQNTFKPTLCSQIRKLINFSWNK
jgi:hypothetical protein